MDYVRESALEILVKHNQEPSHLKHALAVEAAMRHFARQFGEDPDLWGFVGILHDIDWEKTMANPAQHCILARELLAAENMPEHIIRAVVSHGWGLCTDVEPLSSLEKALYAVEELTGLIIACGLVRPSRSLADLTPKSVKKRWKDKSFARGVNRDVIQKGAELLAMPLDELMAGVIDALRPVERQLGLGSEVQA